MSKSTVWLEINGGVRSVMHDKVNGSAHRRQLGGGGGGGFYHIRLHFGHG